MRFSGRSTTSPILIAVGLLLAVLAGVAIPLSSGGLPGPGPDPWTPPAPTASPTETPTSIKTTSLPPAPTPTFTVAPSPVPLTATPTKSAPTPTRATMTVPNSVTPPPDAKAASKPDLTQTPTSAPVGTVRLDPLSVRQQPSKEGTLIGFVQSGEDFTILGRSEDGVWLKFCCFNGAPAWFAAEFVDVSAPVSSLAVLQP